MYIVMLIMAPVMNGLATVLFLLGCWRILITEVTSVDETYQLKWDRLAYMFTIFFAAVVAKFLAT